MKKLTEGKTKIVYDAGADRVVLFSKDDITAGDGAKRDAIRGKAAVATRTTANVFRLLNRHGIETHFLRQLDEARLLCIRCDMIPLEVTVRGSAAGHFLRRHPSAKEGSDLGEPVIEFTFKDDAHHDPLVVTTDGGSWELHDSNKPVTVDTLMVKTDPLLSQKEVNLVQTEAKKVFLVLREAWAKQGIKLIDLKIEFGRTNDNRIVVADVIDNDSWRLWPEGDKSRQLDKQIYREGGSLDEVFRNYKHVAEITDSF